VVEAPTWGGNIEILAWLLQANLVTDPAPGHVLFLETSEEMPPALEVYRTLRNLGERGLLAASPALVMGRPKAWERDHHTSAEQKRQYIADQHEAVLQAMGEYHPQALVVLDV